MQEFTKSDFKNMSRETFYLWIYEYKQQLIGSAVFTKCDKFGSKLVSWAQKIHDKSKEEFIPSHTASIIEYDGELYLFDMKPPKASIQKLTRYLLSTDDEYILVLRDFPLDTFMFSQNLIYHIGEFYAYLSAIRSVFNKRQTKYVRHCSEMHLTELQKQGLYTNVNREITPNELLTLFRQPKYEGLVKYVESEN